MLTMRPEDVEPMVVKWVAFAAFVLSLIANFRIKKGK